MICREWVTNIFGEGRSVSLTNLGTAPAVLELWHLSPPNPRPRNTVLFLQIRLIFHIDKPSTVFLTPLVTFKFRSTAANFSGAS